MTPGTFAKQDSFKVFGPSKALNTYKALNKFGYLLGKGGNKPHAADITANGAVLLIIAIAMDFSPKKSDALKMILNYKSNHISNKSMFDYMVDLFKSGELESISIPKSIDINYVCVSSYIDDIKFTKDGSSIMNLRCYEVTIHASLLMSIRHSIYNQTIEIKPNGDTDAQILKSFDLINQNKPSLKAINEVL
jgi:hypothetical protein